MTQIDDAIREIQQLTDKMRKLTPKGREHSLVITKLEEAGMWAVQMQVTTLLAEVRAQQQEHVPSKPCSAKWWGRCWDKDHNQQCECAGDEAHAGVHRCGRCDPLIGGMGAGESTR